MGGSCSNCGSLLADSDRFCGVCGSRAPEGHEPAPGPADAVEQALLPGSCTECGGPLGTDDRFCGACGVAVAASTSQPETHPRRGRRRHRKAKSTRGFTALVVILGLALGVGAGYALTEWVFSESSSAVVAPTTALSSAAANPTTTETSTTTTSAPVATSTSAVTTTTGEPSTTTTVFGDLGLAQLMAKPACDGRYAVFIGASVEASVYATEISEYLNANPGSNYLRTDVTCSSLRPQTPAGETIYAVYFGPFDTFDEACAVVDSGPSSWYAKPLDNTSDPNVVPTCP